MTLEDTIGTYSLIIPKADALQLAYICLVRYIAKLESVLDNAPYATKHVVLAMYRPLGHASEGSQCGRLAERGGGARLCGRD